MSYKNTITPLTPSFNEKVCAAIIMIPYEISEWSSFSSTIPVNVDIDQHYRITE